MISFEESQRLIEKYVKAGSTVELPLLESIGLTLTRPVAARTDNPRFNASAVDGYAVSLADFSGVVPVTLPLSHAVHAGTASTKPMKPGTAVRILTGAQVPNGTDAIVMQEHVTTLANRITISQIPHAGANIRTKGGEFLKGTQLFEQGTLVTPAVAQSLAACGYSRVKVHARPSVSLIVTGDELRTPSSKLKPGEIWDSNSIGLEAVCRMLGITKLQRTHVSDNVRETTKAVHNALQHSDVSMVTGGVSVGDRDYVKEAFTRNGVREIFWQVSIRPGMPIYFGLKHIKGKPRYIFGLPGNPVSVMVTFQLYVRPVILHMMGHNILLERSKGILATPLKKSIPRTEFVRAYRASAGSDPPRLLPLNARDSHMTTGMAKADSLIVFPAEKAFLDAGTFVEYIPIRWSY